MLHRSSYEVVEVVVDHDRRVLHVSEPSLGLHMIRVSWKTIHFRETLHMESYM